MSRQIPKKEVLIIGAGISGLIAGDLLQKEGQAVTILEKSRGVGGRMATRRNGEAIFDHGAQFYTVADIGFEQRNNQWLQENVSAFWTDEIPGEKGIKPRYKGLPGITSVPKALSRNLNIELSHKAIRVALVGGKWQVETDSGDAFEADWLLLTPPLPQALSLLNDSGIELPAEWDRKLRDSSFASCFALMVQLDKVSLVPEPGGMRLDDPRLSWIGDNHKKGISPVPGSLTLHATPEFTRKHFDSPREDVASLMVEAAKPWLGSAVAWWQLHRWRYSQPLNPLPESFCLLENQGLAFAGDAFGGPRVEGAARSGEDAAKAILSAISGVRT